MSTDRPPPDDAAERMRRIAARAKKRSTQVTRLAELCALEIEALAVQSTAAIAAHVRMYLDRAVEAAVEWHDGGIARLTEDLATAHARIAELECQVDLMRRQLNLKLRGRSDDR